MGCAAMPRQPGMAASKVACRSPRVVAPEKSMVVMTPSTSTSMEPTMSSRPGPRSSPWNRGLSPAGPSRRDIPGASHHAN